MKQLAIFGILLLALSLTSCDKDELEYDYQIQVMSPSTDDKNVDDDMHIHVNFRSLKENTIHHINVRIYDVATGTEIYNMPTMAHLHDMDGYYEHHDDIVLSNANGVNAHSDWILEAKVWGHEAGTEEVVQRVQFHVHP